MNRPYRPSNGSEGADFITHFCGNCQRAAEGDCPIVAASLSFDVDHPSYPKEWVDGDGLGPRCTAFVHVDDEPAGPQRCTQTIDLFDPPGDTPCSHP